MVGRITNSSQIMNKTQHIFSLRLSHGDFKTLEKLSKGLKISRAEVLRKALTAFNLNV